jgi:hypothetical protein
MALLAAAECIKIGYFEQFTFYISNYTDCYYFKFCVI